MMSLQLWHPLHMMMMITFSSGMGGGEMNYILLLRNRLHVTAENSQLASVATLGAHGSAGGPLMNSIVPASRRELPTPQYLTQGKRS